jgi:hypothetical protein
MNFVVRLGLIALAVALLYYVINQYTGATLPVLNDGEVTMGVPQFDEPESHYTEDLPVQEPVPGSPEDMAGASVAKVNWDGLAENQLSGALSKQYQELNADDLLPHNDHSNWADVYPDGVGQLQNKNFLHAGHHVGINTVGQHLKNPNLQLRSEPANPQIQISPWLQSSYGPDLLRRPMEIGGCN